MADDPILALERQLVGAARRRVALPVPAGARPRPARARLRISAGGVALACSLAIMAIVAVAALVGLHGHWRIGTVAPAARPSVQLTLPGVLTALRRSQTAADRAVLAREQRAGAFGGVLPPRALLDAESVRVATTTPWGAEVLLAVVSPSARGTGSSPVHASAIHVPELLVEIAHGGGSDCCETASEVQADGDLTVWRLGGRQWAYAVVPDGVARVAFLSSPAGAPPAGPGTRATVRDNVAAAALPLRATPARLTMIWYAADGQILRRFGDFATPR